MRTNLIIRLPPAFDDHLLTCPLVNRSRSYVSAGPKLSEGQNNWIETRAAFHGRTFEKELGDVVEVIYGVRKPIWEIT